MRAAARALDLLLRPGKAWADIAAARGADGPLLIGHALLLLGPVLVFLASQYALDGLRPEMLTSGTQRNDMAGSVLGTGTRVSLSFTGAQMALLLSALCVVGAACMCWLVLAHGETLGAAADRGGAFRLVLYAMTPGAIGSLLFAVPQIGLLLALTGYVLTVRLFRSGAPVLLPPRPEEAGRYGRIVGRRAAILGLALPLMALVAAAFALAGRIGSPGLPAIAT